MGWWDTGVLGGDPPLDVICGIEAVLGVEDLYPLEAIVEMPLRDGRAALVDALDRIGLGELADRIADPDEPHIAVQVIAAVAMAAGAPLGDFAERARDAARTDPWANAGEEYNASERRAAMGQLIAVIDAYDGTPVAVTSPGLFEKVLGRTQ